VSAVLDFTNPEAVAWFRSQLDYLRSTDQVQGLFPVIVFSSAATTAEAGHKGFNLGSAMIFASSNLSKCEACRWIPRTRINFPRFPERARQAPLDCIIV